jgi:1-aminocyclopropane-1-carboxylate deaminase
VRADVLRLDLIHPFISGNKFFKLKEYLKDAEALKAKTIITFGGAYSNHIIATAAACQLVRLNAVGVIRGEQPSYLSTTLIEAKKLGMELIYVSRDVYKLGVVPDFILQQYPASYIVPEGGYGLNGMLGAKEILGKDTESYTHIMCAVGTGTTLAGLVQASKKHQQIIGISVLKNHFSLADRINDLISEPKKNCFHLVHEFHFGGYAKVNLDLIQFMNLWFNQTAIPSDFVYTAKLFYAFHDLNKNGFFPEGSSILLIHSGGLQGNLSLPKGTLIF